MRCYTIGWALFYFYIFDNCQQAKPWERQHDERRQAEPFPKGERVKSSGACYEECHHSPVGDNCQIAAWMPLDHPSYCLGKPSMGIIGCLSSKDQFLWILKEAGDSRLKLLLGIQRADVTPIMLM